VVLADDGVLPLHNVLGLGLNVLDDARGADPIEVCLTGGDDLPDFLLLPIE
jgi:hypothetical protein